MIFLKIIFSCLLLIRVPDTKKECTDEYDLLNHLACSTDEYALVNSKFISWKSLGYDSFSKVNPINFDFGPNFKEGKKIDFYSLLDRDQILRIDEVLDSELPLEIDSETLSCSNKLKQAQGIIPKKTIYSYSFPILMTGENKELYGIILVDKTFELNSELKLKLFVKKRNSWELVYEELLAFS